MRQLSPKLRDRLTRANRWLWTTAAVLSLLKLGVPYALRKGVGSSVTGPEQCWSGQALNGLDIGSICTTSCTHDDDCSHSMHCAREVCVPRAQKALGTACSGWWECPGGDCLAKNGPFPSGVCTKTCAEDLDCGGALRCDPHHRCLPRPTEPMGAACRSEWECVDGACVTSVAAMMSDKHDQPSSYCTRACPSAADCPPGFGCQSISSQRLCVRGATTSAELDLLDRAKNMPPEEALRALMQGVEQLPAQR